MYVLSFPEKSPTLGEFICFPMPNSKKINLAEKIGINSYDFGVLLLDDNDGCRISAIEKKLGGDVCRINREIFIQWLKGIGKLPITWTTIVEVLHDIGLDKLASDIEEVKSYSVTYNHIL
jgi:hypothetical protein